MACSPIAVSRPKTTSTASVKPARVPNSRKLPQNPRLRSGAYSAMKVAAPPYSPPVEKPWMIRSRNSSAGAAQPIVA